LLAIGVSQGISILTHFPTSDFGKWVKLDIPCKTRIANEMEEWSSACLHLASGTMLVLDIFWTQVEIIRDYSKLISPLH
jgi:hypothetical protein